MSKVYQYIVDVVARTQNFTARMREVISQTQETTQETKKLKDASDQYSNILKDITAGVASAFGAKMIFDFTAEVTKLAAEADGVERAFTRTMKATDLGRLRESVKGTVSDLELMKRAVTARNFGIPVQELGTLLEFAAKRAQDTGQEVDYLVDSIVTGIGRKSPLILDNLGISAVQLKEKLGGISVEAASIADLTKAVGEIAKDSLGETGGLAENTATKLQQMNAQWQNTKVLIGEQVANFGLLKAALDDTVRMFVILQSDLSFWQKINPFELQTKTYEKAVKANKQRDDRAALSMYGEDTVMPTDISKKQNLELAVANLKKYRSELQMAGKDTTEVSKQIASHQSQIAKLALPVDPGKKEPEKTAYEQLGLSIAALTKQQQALALAGKDTSGIAAQIAALQKQKEAADQLVESQKTTVAKTAYEQLSNSIETLIKRQQELAKAGKDTSGIQEQVTALERQKAVTDKLVQSRNPEVAQTAYNALSGSVALLVAQYEKLNREGKDVSGISEQIGALSRQKETADLVAKSLASTMKPEGYEAVTAAIADLKKEQENLTLAGKDTTGISAQMAALERLKENVDFLAASYRLAARLGKEVLELPVNVITPKAAGLAQGLTTVETEEEKDGKKVKKRELAIKDDKGEVKKMGLVIDPDMGEKTKEKIQGIIEQSEELRKTWSDLTQEAGVNFQVIGDAIGGAAGSWVGFFGYLVQQIPVLISQITALSLASVAGSNAEANASGVAALNEGVKQGAKVKFPFNLIAIAATVAAIMAALSNATKVKRYEAGGIAYAPTVGLFGEYPGASTNPEVVAPLNRLRDLIKPAGGTTVIMPAGVEIDGYKLRVLLKRVDNSISKRV